MASKRRNMFQKNKTQETTENEFSPEVQQLLAQQANMAAQATTQLGSNPVATAIQWLNTLMMQAINVPEFEGESGMLTDFLERGTNIMNQVTGSGLDEGSTRAVRQMLIGRISVVVRRELGINVTEQWDAVVKRLKEGYGGARKFYQRQVVSLILTGRSKGESPGAYAQSMEAQVRVLCDRILETEEDKIKAQHAIELVKSLIVERIKRELPDRIKKALKPTGTPLRLDEAIDVIREEDEEFLESRRVEEGWTRVPYRHQKRETQRREYRSRPEPMEVNFGDLVRQYDDRRRRYVWTGKDESGSSTEEEEGRGASSGGESSSGREKKKKKTTYAGVVNKSETRTKEFRVRETEKLDGPIEINIVNVDGESGKFRKLFEKLTYKEGEILEATKRIKHRIDLIDDRPTYSKPRRYPVAFREIIREHIKEMLDTGVLRESVSTFNSPLWVVPKKLDKSGVQKYRVVVDYRELNKRKKTEKYPLPRLEEMIDRMSGTEIFSVFDLKSGYHQIPMETRDIEKTSIQFERGKYEFVRMPFGLKNAPITFQRMIDDFLLGLDESFIQAYMDDLIIFRKSVEDHERQLIKVKNRLEEFGLKISGDKSYFGLKEVQFMGHIISKQGAQPDPKKVTAIKEIETPKNIKELRSFLGMINYYRRFINNLAGKTERLTKLLKKNTKFVINEEAKEAFNWCKEKLATVPILQFPDFEKQFILTTDASQVAVGAVVSQGEGDSERPIAFASKKLTPAETRYSTIERELLGIVWATKHFRPYLLGRQFKIMTDHKPLVWVKKLEEISAKISRWKETLAGYNFEIVHTRGRDNVVADCLSRQVNAIDDVDADYAERFLRSWLGESSEASGTDSEEPWGFEPLPNTSNEPTNRTMTVDKGIINDKHNQLIVVRTEGQGIETRGHT
ncbi:hypothetical protein AAG570_001437 [Ranatra chinensis]|uniref:Reverse transcriptase domain-containing protein n=1 Tax=Ranatra chinensis TaxID=642074 RepID=A0ABD0YBV6_9HEMI